MADDDVWNIETCSKNWKALLCFYKYLQHLRYQDPLVKWYYDEQPFLSKPF